MVLYLEVCDLSRALTVYSANKPAVDTANSVSSLYSFMGYSINYLLWLWLPARTEWQPTLRAPAAGRKQSRACLPRLGPAWPGLLWLGNFSKSVSLSLSGEHCPPERSCHIGMLEELGPRTDHWRSCTTLHLFCIEIFHLQSAHDWALWSLKMCQISDKPKL